ncbi:PREDICTED: transcriptional repressor NF-X1 homolog [Rhagoletis zephyria]|uniref:transcriptional repressor NF-X1 homolog n=1 Tax=Rhagoletis zephyria TaxID=28612 RepID=UPI000811A963|nr:PREDICTED: transcriptional repressor NF-X1 homolog [Rhagoletis zephyria]
MGCSSEAARTRTQRSSINGYYKHKNNTNNSTISYSNSNCNCNNTNNNCCDNYKSSSDSNSLRLLSAEVICQSTVDSDEEPTISKENNCQRQTDTTTVTTVIENTQKQQRERELKVEGAKAEDTEKLRQIEYSQSESVEAEVVGVAVEGLLCTVGGRHCELYATCVNCCPSEFDINAQHNSSSNDKESCYANFRHRTASGRNNCCHRQLPQELPHTRDELPPQARQEYEPEKPRENETWRAAYGSLALRREMETSAPP